MKNDYAVAFPDRLKSAAKARRLLIDQLRPKPARPDPLHAERGAMRQAELATVRAERLAARAAKKIAAAGLAGDAERARIAAEGVALGLNREARKERKAMSAIEAKAKRDARYAARKARA